MFILVLSSYTWHESESIWERQVNQWFSDGVSCYGFEMLIWFLSSFAVKAKSSLLQRKKSIICKSNLNYLSSYFIINIQMLYKCLNTQFKMNFLSLLITNLPTALMHNCSCLKGESLSTCLFIQVMVLLPICVYLRKIVVQGENEIM